MSVHTIMLIEDDEALATAMAQTLERYGYIAVRVSDFRRVEEAFLAHRPISC